MSNKKLPDKSQASLVSFYYMWKKTRTHVSLMDQHQSNTKHNSMLDNNEEIVNGQNNGKKKTNGEATNNNLSDNEDSIDNNVNQNHVNYDEDAEDNEEEDDENFNVSFFKVLLEFSMITKFRTFCYLE